MKYLFLLTAIMLYASTTTACGSQTISTDTEIVVTTDGQDLTCDTCDTEPPPPPTCNGYCYLGITCVNNKTDTLNTWGEPCSKDYPNAFSEHWYYCAKPDIYTSDSWVKDTCSANCTYPYVLTFTGNICVGYSV